MVVALAPVQVVVDGQSARPISRCYEKATSKQWTQPIGFAHGCSRSPSMRSSAARDVDSNEAIRDAVALTKAGHGRRSRRLGQRTGEERGEDAARLVVSGSKGRRIRFDLAIVNNQLAPNVPLSGPLKLIG